MKKPEKLLVIRDQRTSDASRRRRGLLHQACRDVIAQRDTLAGFALIAWDRQGDLSSAVRCWDGSPIGPALVPTLVHDALNRHIAVDLAQRERSEAGG